MKFNVTTAIAYVNAEPHIGFTFELLAADVLVRYHALLGDDVRFVTGTDEHGIKVARSAEKAGMEPAPFTDKIAGRFKDLADALGITDHVFVRTSDEGHKKVAQEIWRSADANGDIYKKKYKGLYCAGCEAFLAPNEINPDGTCCTHNNKPEELEEENYFFKLSKYNDWLKKHLKDHPEFVRPEGRYNEIAALVKGGLEDISISRPKEKLSWGVPVPGDPDHVMYVWFDALTNYLTGSGFLTDDEDFEKMWPADVHIIGQDILRFHAALWPAMLKSAGLSIPKQVYPHGMILSGDGRKMSKSLGNVVDPFVIIKKYGLASTRYFLLAEVPFSDGGRFSEERLVERYNSELANGIGNFVSRVVTMSHKFVEGKVPVAENAPALLKQREKLYKAYDLAMPELRFHDALAALNQFVAWANQYVDQEKPWVLAKEDAVRLQTVLLTLLEAIKTVGIHLVPVIPAMAEKILSLVNVDEAAKMETLREEPLTPGTTVRKSEIIFPRIETVSK